jgi:membrane-bound ClpP family serine protease
VGNRQGTKQWLVRWGFAGVVGAVAIASLLVAVTVAIPADVPGFALAAAPVYRLEVGGAIFVGLYLAATAFVLALQNRAFTEFGSGGMRARSLVDLPTALQTNDRALNGLLEVLDGIWRLREDPSGE